MSVSAQKVSSASLGLIALTALTMSAFAANSLLARAALLDGAIDPASFSALRLLSGATVLSLAHFLRRSSPMGGNTVSAFWLLVYVVPFSFAYLTLPTGTGALILFGCVQLTMLGFALLKGERWGLLRWAGIGSALFGLVVLLLPGLQAPEPLGALAMAAAGIGWGMYSLRGKGAQSPLAESAGNFLRGVPAVLVLFVWASLSDQTSMDSGGVTLALLSGGVTSGLGYALWYAVLPRLSSSTAASVQLTVPLLATIFGAALLGESVSLRLGISSVLILGGVFVVLTSRAQAE